MLFQLAIPTDDTLNGILSCLPWMHSAGLLGVFCDIFHKAILLRTMRTNPHMHHLVARHHLPELSGDVTSPVVSADLQLF